MAKKRSTALSLHIGLNRVDPKHYAGWDGPLSACEADARDMAALAKDQGMRPTLLLTASATRAGVLRNIRRAVSRLKKGDFFLLTYSGHGGQVDDVSGEEEDKLDETWCLFDAELIDDELYLELCKFAKGVRVLVLSDSCHSGTVVRARPVGGASVGRSKMMPPSVARAVYLAHKDFYDGLQRAVAREATSNKRGRRSTAVADPDEALAQIAVSSRLTNIRTVCKASVILISGCQDNQTSMDGERNGAFTEQLLAVWDHAMFRGTYLTFHSHIKGRMSRSQTPHLFFLGPATTFARQRPFTV